MRACARLEHATPPRATPARTLWLTLYAPFGRLQESPDGFYGTICSAETLSLIGLTSSVQQKVDSNVSGLSASGRTVYDALRLLGARHSRRQHVVRRPPLAERPEMQMSTFCCTELVGPIKESVSAEQIVP